MGLSFPNISHCFFFATLIDNSNDRTQHVLMQASRNTEANVAEIASDIQAVVAQAIRRQKATSHEEFRKQRNPDEMVAWIASNVQQTVNEYIDQRMDTVTSEVLQSSRKLSRSIDSQLQRTGIPMQQETAAPRCTSDSSTAEERVLGVTSALANMRDLIDMQDKTLIGLVCKLDELRSEIKRMEPNCNAEVCHELGELRHRINRLGTISNTHLNTVPEDITGSRYGEIYLAPVDKCERNMEAVTEGLLELGRRLSIINETCAEKENEDPFNKHHTDGDKIVNAKPSERGRRVSFADACQKPKEDKRGRRRNRQVHEKGREHPTTQQPRRPNGPLEAIEAVHPQNKHCRNVSSRKPSH